MVNEFKARLGYIDSKTHTKREEERKQRDRAGGGGRARTLPVGMLVSVNEPQNFIYA